MRSPRRASTMLSSRPPPLPRAGMQSTMSWNRDEGTWEAVQ